MNNQTNEKNYPVFKRREGGISASVFNSQYGFSVSFQKYSKNQQTGEEKRQQAYLNPNDLLKAIYVLEEVKRWITANTPDKPKQQQQNPRFNPPPATPPAHPYPQGGQVQHPFGG